MNRFKFLFLVSIVTLFFPRAILASPESIMGSGNLYAGDSISTSDDKLNGLNQVGVKIVRIGIYPSQYWKQENSNSPNPQNLDETILNVYKHGIKPMILFAHDGKTASIGTYDQWYKTGLAFAKRFKPNSSWLLSQGIKNWGIEVYSAVNEPGGTGFPIEGSQSYYNLIQGLADGVHAADSSLKVIPGGFRSRGDEYDTYLKAIAPLFNKGKLDGIDLHVYRSWWHVTNKNAFDFSAQNSFEKAKQVAGITADINYYCTEFNSQGDQMTETEAAKLFLTLFWDQLGVIKNSGEDATQIAMTWSLFNTTTDKKYGMVESLNPWKLTLRAEVMKLALDLSKDMEFIYVDPKKKGVYVLQKKQDNKITKMWIWQNFNQWTDKPRTTFRINYLPQNATKVKVYGWDGLRKTYNLSNTDYLVINNLSPNETYMFVAE
jgi:hypothetical protein